MTVLLAIITVVLLLALYVQVKEKNALKIMVEPAQKIKDADEYSRKTKREADEYSFSKKQESGEYYRNKKKEADEYCAKQEQKTKSLEQQVAQLTQQKKQLEKELKIYDSEILLAAVDISAYENLRSDEIKNQLALLRGKQDQLIKDGGALQVTNTGTKREVDSQKKQILRCFNAECSIIIGNVTAKNVDTARSKIQRSFDAINKIFTIDGVAIQQSFLSMKFEELSLVYAYAMKAEEEREQRKVIREQMAEEEKVRREIERAKQKIEKEMTQFSNEVNKLTKYMQKSKDDTERQMYMNKIQELEDKLKALESDKENAVQREQNTRAGFVYIISNIGSFGEKVYKIGMTRRLEPMDRIAELSSASVPFPFDVHAMIFAEDAPALEHLLHQHFAAQRVNKANPRKEFFRVDLDEVKNLIHEQYNNTVQFIDVPEATEYHETLRLEKEIA